MSYSFYPDSFNYDLVSKKFKDNDEFINCLILYRNRFEELIKKYVDFSEIDNLINIDIPLVDDAKYNFYRNFSTFGNNYIYLRNNFHVERLTEEEIKKVLNNDLEDEFILNTYKNLIFESEGKVEVNYEDIGSFVNGNTLWFEFAYDSSLVKKLSEQKRIESVIYNVNNFIRDNIASNFDIECTFITYDCLPRLYDNK